MFCVQYVYKAVVSARNNQKLILLCINIHTRNKMTAKGFLVQMWTNRGTFTRPTIVQKAATVRMTVACLYTER
ncbi:hypothetical protein GDO78_003877 [Eleutherodactylus coqui]|uniref:Uncharacterized protein n=1 Tax=Eleutherodactylus coqui TaxID=57060 RepID=A0A8J6K1U3_ELECQ|nr:hypothetical protein GDO78_003877 [Eleutherodactylus coqui]